MVDLLQLLDPPLRLGGTHPALVCGGGGGGKLLKAGERPRVPGTNEVGHQRLPVLGPLLQDGQFALGRRRGRVQHAGRRQQVAQAGHRPLQLHHPHALAAFQVPQPDTLVLAARGQPAAVQAETEGRDPALVTGHRGGRHGFMADRHRARRRSQLDGVDGAVVPAGVHGVRVHRHGVKGDGKRDGQQQLAGDQAKEFAGLVQRHGHGFGVLTAAPRGEGQVGDRQRVVTPRPFGLRLPNLKKEKNLLLTYLMVKSS